MSYFIIVIYEFLKYIYVIFLIEQLKCLPFNILQRLNETTLIEKISGTERSRNFQKRNVPEKKRLLEMEWSDLGTKSFHLQYDSFETASETNLFCNEIWYFITKKVGFIADLKRIKLPFRDISKLRRWTMDGAAIYRIMRQKSDPCYWKIGLISQE